MAARKEEFFRKARSSFDHVLAYEDARLQQKARDLIPYDELRSKASAKAKELALGEKHLRDLLLLELLAWFKHSFFSWVDKPRCGDCDNGETVSLGMTSPTAADLAFGASRVESFECVRCKALTRFPRYNDPGKLLETRRGRCGEWANCFTLCCRSVGYDARYVLDWTDHVWTEVYSDVEARWLHCDPCENVCDRPLLYEAGWGKKLTYVIAFSRDDVQDVTWRYSARHDEVLGRRNDVPEPWLVWLVTKLRSERLAQAGAARKQHLLERCVRELVELMNVRTSTDDEELRGRQTGSIEWRRARGELGGGAVEKSPSYVVVPTEAELERGRVELRYDCSQDVYARGDERIEGWKSLIFEAKGGIQRKVEYDWDMVYLARTENSDRSSATWKIDLTATGTSVDRVEVEVHGTCFESGQVVWKLDGDKNTVRLRDGERQQVTTDLRGSKVVRLTAEMSDGSWQHTQLFRQKRVSPDDDESTWTWPFHLLVYLRK